ADANDYDLTYYTYNFKVTVSGTNAFVLNWQSSTESLYRINKLLGFDAEDTDSDTSHLSQHAVDLSQPDMIFIEINTISSGFITSNSLTSSNSFTFGIPLEKRTGELEVYKNTEHSDLFNRIRFDTPITLKNLEIRLCDKNRT